MWLWYNAAVWNIISLFSMKRTKIDKKMKYTWFRLKLDNINAKITNKQIYRIKITVFPIKYLDFVWIQKFFCLIKKRKELFWRMLRKRKSKENKCELALRNYRFWSCINKIEEHRDHKQMNFHQRGYQLMCIFIRFWFNSTN